jgi:hypothetical protein
MKTYDFEGSIVDNPAEKAYTNNENSAVNSNSYDFNNINTGFNPLVIYNAINKYYSMKKLLQDLELYWGQSSMYCPFHDDELTGKPSARYHEDSDSLYCFSEHKVYTAYHVLKLLYKDDIRIRFREAWANLSEQEREEILREFEDSEARDSDISKYVHPVWSGLRFVLEKFKTGEVNFRQHKNALRKVLKMMHEEDLNNKMKAGNN